MGEGAVGRQPRFQLFLLVKTEELVMMQASPAKSLIRSFLPFLLALSIFSIVSGLDQSPDTQLAHGNVLKELSDHEVIRKEREALPKDQNRPKNDSKQKKQANKAKKKKKSDRKARKGKQKNKKTGKGSRAKKKKKARRNRKAKGKKAGKAQDKKKKSVRKANKRKKKRKNAGNKKAG